MNSIERRRMDGNVDINEKELIPSASVLVESLRAFGYELETAIADLIDNSITAGAKNICVDFDWDGDKSSIRLQDDGIGMDEEILFNAMRLGSISPLATRSSSDLGRFGLGLKTASFSQCRCLTVKTKKKNTQFVIWTWDLDYVEKTNKWVIIKGCPDYIKKGVENISLKEQGTVVVWTNLDKLTSGTQTDNIEDHKHFLARIDKTSKYIGMVFHEFIENGICIMVNGNPIKPWDPFLSKHEATQKLAEETISEGVNVIPYVLPHISKMSQPEHKAAAGIRGWSEHQGFYIYRNNRLLVAGDWLGFFIKEHHCELARIRIDIKNDLDKEWGIDVKKSKASPPDDLKSILKNIADRTRKRALEVYRFRGAKLTPAGSQGIIFLWEQEKRHGKIRYTINRDHPVIKQALNSVTDRGKFTRMLRLIEESIPVPLIKIANAEAPESEAAPFDNAQMREKLAIAEDIYECLKTSGLDHDEIIIKMSMIDYFNKFPELIQMIKDRYS